MVGKLKPITPMQFIWTLITALCQIFMSQYLFLSSAYSIGAYQTAIWQPIVPIIATIISLYLSLEPRTAFKITGIVLSLASMVINMYFSNFFSSEAEHYIYRNLYLAF